MCWGVHCPRQLQAGDAPLILGPKFLISSIFGRTSTVVRDQPSSLTRLVQLGGVQFLDWRPLVLLETSRFGQPKCDFVSGRERVTLVSEQAWAFDRTEDHNESIVLQVTKSRQVARSSSPKINGGRATCQLHLIVKVIGVVPSSSIRQCTTARGSDGRTKLIYTRTVQ